MTTTIQPPRSPQPVGPDQPPRRTGHALLMVAGMLVGLLGLTLAGVASAAGWVAAGCAAAGWAGAASRCASTSFRVTRPARPVPWIAPISRLCSAAILRTSGVDFRRSRSSILSAAPFPPVASPTDRLSPDEALEVVAGVARGEGAAGFSPEGRGGLAGAGASGAGAGDG